MKALRRFVSEQDSQRAVQSGCESESDAAIYVNGRIGNSKCISWIEIGTDTKENEKLGLSGPRNLPESLRGCFERSKATSIVRVQEPERGAEGLKRDMDWDRTETELGPT
jgi:hypothetical protein